uniref:Methionyl-tRNA synthetase 2, mitochondrial n=1 Tax=Eptatretus burgeri TaxID=7764 RepID=A0A8C4QK52_EPTBU
MMASWPLCTVATVFIKRTCLTHGYIVPKIRGLWQQAIRRPNRWTSNPTGFGRSADVDGSHGLREFASVNGSDCSDGGSQDARGFFISTPIFYVNAEPHIGHLYSVALADCLHRQHSLCGLQGKLSTGTDEHGIKIQRAAKQMGRSPSDHCAAISAKFATLFQQANVAATDFVRTTEERHIQAVQHFWQTLLHRGHIYRGRYEGWYSSADEAFLTKDQVKQSGDHRNNIMVSIESGQPVDWIAEDNYMFRSCSILLFLWYIWKRFI